MKESTLIELGNQFKAAMAARYQLPELNVTPFTVSKVDGDFCLVKTEDVTVVPTGQMAGIVKKMTARVEVDSNGRHTRGSIHYRYEHHNGGSNGSEQVFVIVTESRYGGERTEYVGEISERLAYVYEGQQAEAREAKNVKA